LADNITRHRTTPTLERRSNDVPQLLRTQSAGHRMTLRMLDLFCGAGGAGVGYARAGFDVSGIDINPKAVTTNPHPTVIADAINWLRWAAGENPPSPQLAAAYLEPEYLDAIHASPPGYSEPGRR
jgi:2-polyprenyl-3-methyl-5-hydroxy-6-metoxy-1,4-benzoquinol methylase